MKTITISLLSLLSLFSCAMVQAQRQSFIADSISIKLLPEYDRVGSLHRKLFGENYRKEYAMATRLPIIRVSGIAGGLRATEAGGGFQTRSVRLIDPQGNEWVLRSVQKFPEMLLPVELRETFLKDVLKDNMSAQHPFSALIVPPLAQAIGVPHSSPMIGWVESDRNLGQFNKEFSGTVCLLEQREPIGKSDNTEKMLRKLREDSNYSLAVEMYLMAKCLDVLIGDWDRHEDQWRWKAMKSPGGIRYLPIPRDHDQVFYRSDGKIQHAAQATWFLPMMQGYERDITNINWFLWEGREINSRWFSQLDERQWNSIVAEFCSRMTDSVLFTALKRLPEPAYSLRRDQLMEQLLIRRSQLPKLMSTYYRFFNRIVDIELSDKDENVNISTNPQGGLTVVAYKAGKEHQAGDILYRREFDPAITREIRLYLHQGRDNVKVADNSSKISLRIIGGRGSTKSYQVDQSSAKIRVYNTFDTTSFSGSGLAKLVNHRSKDSANVAYVAKDLYRRHLIYPELAYNRDDGLAVGISLRFKNPGFRKIPFGSLQTFAASYAFASSATEFGYQGEWTRVLGRADLVLKVSLQAPYTQNFFGKGNASIYQRDKDIDFYRARFSILELLPALRWGDSTSVFTAGPALQYYTLRERSNTGRLVSEPERLGSYDSLSLAERKIFAGVALGYTYSTRDHNLLPTRGVFLGSRLVGYKGLNNASRDFVQLNVSVSVHQKLDRHAALVLVDRIGGGITLGKTAFYQSQFLGGQGNLLGYRQYRFAGEHMLFNNLELRFKAANFVSYILPGQLGFLALYDVGRVWREQESSQLWHHGIGAGVYFAPASLSLLRLVVSRSSEGWYPNFGLSFRY